MSVQYHEDDLGLLTEDQGPFAPERIPDGVEVYSRRWEGTCVCREHFTLTYSATAVTEHGALAVDTVLETISDSGTDQLAEYAGAASYFTVHDAAGAARRAVEMFDPARDAAGCPRCDR